MNLGDLALVLTAFAGLLTSGAAAWVQIRRTVRLEVTEQLSSATAPEPA